MEPYSKTMSNTLCLYHGDNEAVRQAICLVDPRVVSALKDCYSESNDLQNKYGGAAMRLIDAAFSIRRDKDTRKQLTELLLGIGFKKANISLMLTARQKAWQLQKDSSDSAEWFNALPVSSAYELATCTDEAFNRVWANDSEWGKKKLSRKEIRELTASYDEKFSRQTFDEPKQPLSILEKGLKLFKDYPDIVELIQQKLAQD